MKEALDELKHSDKAKDMKEQVGGWGLQGLSRPDFKSAVSSPPLSALQEMWLQPRTASLPHLPSSSSPPLSRPAGDVAAAGSDRVPDWRSGQGRQDHGQAATRWVVRMIENVWGLFSPCRSFTPVPDRPSPPCPSPLMHNVAVHTRPGSPLTPLAPPPLALNCTDEPKFGK